METGLTSGVTDAPKNRFKNFSSQIGKIFIVTLAIVIGFICGEYYYKSKETKRNNLPMDFKNIRKIDETSIAINERDELMIINRKSGKYEIYDSAVGRVVFRMYASQMAAKR
jgi:hypothetical protein